MRAVLCKASVCVSLAGIFVTTQAKATSVVLAVGVNQSFETGLQPLKYAVDDAEHFATTMQNVGSLVGGDIELKNNPTRAELSAAFDKVKHEFTSGEPGGVQKFVFYFSGHSDERGLHLRDALLTKDELHRQLEQIPARTKIVILDSCYSGALAYRGIKPTSDFQKPKIALDEPAGTIFLTATSGRDQAAESATARGGLFTHSVIDGLNGAADLDGDGVVTAMELYEYAFRQTQLSSFMLPVGTPQKPELVADLKGRGAVTMSFPAGRMGAVRLPEAAQGAVSLQSLAGASAVELTKTAGATTDVPMPAGKYRVWLRDGGRVAQADVAVQPAVTTLLAMNDLGWRQDTEPLAMAKGASTAATESPRISAMIGMTPNADDKDFELGIRRRRGVPYSGVSMTMSGREQTRQMRMGVVEEKRYALASSYIWDVVDSSVIGLAFDIGGGAAVSNLKVESGTSPSPVFYGGVPLANRDSVSEQHYYPIGRVGLRLSVLRTVWLAYYYEGNPAPYGDRHPMAQDRWETLGLGVTL